MQKRFTTIIIDDEPLARQRLEKLLLNFPEIIEIIGSAKNGMDALNQINHLKPDLIFLDIEMPGLTGFELIERLHKIPLIVFCTAHDEYSLQAFETNSIDYLVKPVRLERLKKTFNKLQQFKGSSESQNLLEVIKSITAEKEAEKMTSITVKKGNKLIFIKLADVTYFEAKDKYVNVVINQGHHISEKSLSQLEDKLPHYFLRVHRAFIINTNYVVEIQKYFNSRYIIKLSNKGLASVTSGRSYIEKIKNWISV